MTERENFMIALNGGVPEWVPNFETAADLIIPAILLGHFMTEEKRDFFSVPWTINESGPMIDNHQPYVMDDVNDWKQFVHFPDPAEFPWEAVAAQQLAEHDPDKAIVIMPNMGGGTIWMPLINMMGFEEGLCAMYEEPEVCREFFEYVTDFFVKCVPYIVKYYKPDAFIVGDDLATATSAFISMDTYRDLLKPLYQRTIDAVHKEGVHAELHMCGKCEEFVEDFIAMGADSWQPAQTSNDLVGLKARHPKFALVGAWDTQSPAWQPGAPESAAREEVHRVIDELAPGGSFILWTGGSVGTSPDQLARQTWVNEECAAYGRKVYQN